MLSILGSIAAAIVNVLLRMFFPGHPQVTPEVQAQAQKDRADTLQSQKDAGREADKIRADVGRRIGTDAVGAPGSGVFKPDANEREDG